MQKTLIIKQPRIAIQGLGENAKGVFLKIQIHKTIYRYYNSVWIGYGRWQINDNINIPIYHDDNYFELEVAIDSNPYPLIIAETKISIDYIFKSIVKSTQIKNPLHLQDLIVGWLYFQPIFINTQQPILKCPPQVLYLKVIQVKLIKQFDEEIKCRIYSQEKMIVEKLINKKCTKAIFTLQLMLRVKPSSLIKICFIKVDQSEMKVSFIIDNIERGQLSTINLYLSQKSRRVGDVQVRYFLQNIFIPNQNHNILKKLVVLKQKNKQLQSCKEIPQEQKIKIHKRQLNSQLPKLQQNIKLPVLNHSNQIEKKVEQIQQYLKNLGKGIYKQNKLKKLPFQLSKSSLRDRQKKKKIDYYFKNVQKIN